MAPYPTITVGDLSDFSGRPEILYSDHADESLRQAALFLRLRTGYVELPEDPDLQEVFRLAIMDLADRFYLERQFYREKASPVISETIGGYSYSKSQTAQTALYGQNPTGIMWFDVLLLALEDIDNVTTPRFAHGSVHIFENDDVYGPADNRWVIGPKNRPEYPFGSHFFG